MTRKDFKLIAEVISKLDVSEADRLHIASAFADELRYTNGRFDRDRFIHACTGRYES